MKNLNIAIKELRVSRNLTRKQLAEELNISYAALSKYETGERCPDVPTILSFANYFDVSTDFLLDNFNPTSQIALQGNRSAQDYEYWKLYESLSASQKEIAYAYTKLIKDMNLDKL